MVAKLLVVTGDVLPWHAQLLTVVLFLLPPNNLVNSVLPDTLEDA